jgi:calcineurin-like phosphoesterase family protein
MHETIRNNWNNKITNGDTVYILGDISLKGRSEDLIAFVSTLKGKKILIKGNHDDVSDLRYKQLFAEIYDYKEVTDNIDGKQQKVVLSHYPIFSWNGLNKGWIHLYGHVHEGVEENIYRTTIEAIDGHHGKLQSRKPTAINVGCMKKYMNYTPQSLKELLAREE